jgi:hypothetical protein
MGGRSRYIFADQAGLRTASTSDLGFALRRLSVRPYKQATSAVYFPQLESCRCTRDLLPHCVRSLLADAVTWPFLKALWSHLDAVTYGYYLPHLGIGAFA